MSRLGAGRHGRIGMALCLWWLLGALVAVGVQAATFQISVWSTPMEGGTVLGDGVYSSGDLVELTAVAMSGYAFVRWTEDGQTISTDPSLFFAAERHRLLTAHFALQQAIIGFSGHWVGSLLLLPGLSVGAQRFELGLRHPQGSNVWDARVSASFSQDGDWTSLQFSGSGQLGDLRINTGLLFDPQGPSYRSSFLATQWTGQGMTVGFRADHTALGGSPPGPYLLYTWTLRTGTLSVTARLEEPCGQGLSFRDFRAQITGIELCCGITLRGVVSFAECGFECISLYADRIPVTDGLSVDVAVRYCLDGKEVSMTPRWDPICLPCVTLYGDLDQGGTDLYGIKIRCCLSTDLSIPDCPDCPPTRCPPGSRVGSPYLEYVVATDPSKVPVGFQGDEFSYVKIGHCGEGCCGGAFDVELAAFFSPSGSLFGLSRIVGYLAVPWSEALRWTVDVEFDFVGGDTTLTLGWDYRF